MKMSLNAYESSETFSQRRIRNRKVAAATVLGSMIEWYDFYLYATMASIVFPKVFFPKGNAEIATLLAFSTFAIGFIARPFGGLFFGYLSDRFGRTLVLSITFCLMGISTILIGCIPNYDTIGYAAPICLIIVRIFQGMGAGAELATASVTAYEHADEANRGKQGGWPALGLNLGLLLSSLVVFILSINGDEFLINGGWRIPFIASLFLVFIGIWVRKSVPETPDFKKIQRDVAGKTKEKRFRIIIDLFKNNYKSIAVVFFVTGGLNALSYIFKAFSLAYLTQFKKVDAHVTSLSITIASIVAIFMVPLFGQLCDRWGSKKVLITAGIISCLFAWPFMVLLETGNSTMVYIAIGIGTGIITPMMITPQGSFLPRQFPAAVRVSGVGTAREIGSAIAGGLAPLFALSLVAGSGTHSTVGVILLLMFSGVTLVIATLYDQGCKNSLN